MSGYSELGFIQDNGENNQTIKVVKEISIPVWSSNGKLLFVLTGGPSTYHGYPAFWDLENGRFKVCKRNLTFFDQIQSSGNIENPYEAIIQNNWEIIKINLHGCEQIETLVDYTDGPGKYELAGFSYYPATQELVYGLVINPYKQREYQLIKLDLKSGEQVKLGEGVNPSWSPDGTKITYLGLDGLYLMDPTTTEPKRLITKAFFDPWGGGSRWSDSTLPRWSSDGKWIVYHRCDSADICMQEDAKIYKISSSGGPEILLQSGGEFPDWGDR
jgi:hypothetical protein